MLELIVMLQTYLPMKQFRDKSRSKYFFDNHYFDSSWELAYYIWLVDKGITFEYHPNVFFEYTIQGDDKVHKYFPDFLVDGKFVEIKGDDQIKNGTMIDKCNHEKNLVAQAKYNCMLANNILILLGKDIKPYLRYVFQKYGKSYISSYRISTKKGIE